MSTTGENEQGLRAIIDLLRKCSIVILGLHFYVSCYRAFEQWKLTADIVKKFLLNLGRTGLFSNPHVTKATALSLLVLSLIGAKGKKDEKISGGAIGGYIFSGTLLYFGSSFLFYLDLTVEQMAIGYIAVTSIGYLSVLTGGARLSRLLKLRLGRDPFNELNETFPQMEQLIENEFSVNLRGEYNLKGRLRRMYVNIVNPFRSTLCIGNPGSGKSRWVVNSFIRQNIAKNYTLLCYDFKYPDLTNIVYNNYLKHRKSYPVEPKFYNICFDDLSRSHRCNPLDPKSMSDITDAAEASRTILYALNRDWIKRQGEFFTESAVNFVTACMWFLRKYKDGVHCTLPHLIEFMSLEYDDLFPILETEPELESWVNPFRSAYQNNAREQLEGQVASAKIAMARLASPQLYYILNGNDFTLDINNPQEPKILCLGNNPLKIQIYGAVLSLYVTRLLKLVNQKGKQKCSLIFDEYPTLYSPLDTVIATGRGHLISCLIAVQSLEQLRKDYGRELADVVMNICGNIISGATSGETAKHLSERFGKIVQERESVSINRQDTSVSRSSQLDSAMPASKIAGLSSGEFVGSVADNPHEPIKLKNFHCRIINDEEAIKAEEATMKPLPKVRGVSQEEILDNYIQVAVQNNYIQVKNDIFDLREREIRRIKNDPNLSHLLFVKPDEEEEDT